MKKLLIFSSLFILVLAGCSSDSSSPTSPDTGEAPLAQATIDETGGTLEAQGFVLTVPAGALNQATVLKLFTEEPGTVFENDEAAPIFRLEGLPAGLTTGLPLRLTHSSATGDSLYALLGKSSWVPSLQATALNWEVADCSDSLGWALLEIPAREWPPDKSDPAPIRVTVIRGVAQLETDDGKFRLYWSPRMATSANVTALKGYLEEAMALYDFMGFQQEGFDAWPVKAIIMPLDYYGSWNPNPDRLGGHLEFNTRELPDAVEIKVTAAHELLHFCQYFYDPRSVWERGMISNNLVWLDEATAVYIEDYFAPDENYCSSSRGGRELTPLSGINTPAPGFDLGDHGYGMSSLIRYLAQTEGDDFLLDTYQRIKAGTELVAALNASVDLDISDQWRDFLEELLTGRIYRDVDMVVLMDYPTPTLMTIGSAGDSVGSYPREYSDLSGQTFSTSWSSGFQFSTSQRLEFWCDSPEYSISVFGIMLPDTRTLLSHAYGKVTLGNLPALQENYHDLLVLVANQRMVGPDYLGPTEITLEGRLRATEPPAGYDHGRLLIRYEADWSTGQHTMYQDMTFAEVAGVFNGSSFTASWDSTASNGVHYSGHLNVTFDPVDLHALSWSARNYSWMDDGTSADFQASGTELPEVQVSPTHLESYVEGVAASASIGSLSVTYVNSEGETYRTLDSWTCNSGSYVKVLLDDRHGP
jgi:hypothetical protein